MDIYYSQSAYLEDVDEDEDVRYVCQATWAISKPAVAGACPEVSNCCGGNIQPAIKEELTYYYDMTIELPLWPPTEFHLISPGTAMSYPPWN